MAEREQGEVADNWSYAHHCERIRNQLVDQYLRDARSGFGIYLLVWQGKQQKWKNEKWLTFHSLLQRLQEEANSIMRSRSDVEKIMVVGIDLPQRMKHPSEVLERGSRRNSKSKTKR